VNDNPDSAGKLEAYKKQNSTYRGKRRDAGDLPVYGLTNLARTGDCCGSCYTGSGIDGFIAFEMGKMFAPFGKILLAGDLRRIMALACNALAPSISSLDAARMAAIDFT